jgi:hypothetical protein
MAVLEMRRMRNRYRLSPSRLAARERLDQIVVSILDGDLEQALQTSGLEVGGEICIRRLDVPVRVRLSGSDTAIAAAWCRAIAAALAAAVAKRDPDVARYDSLRQALFEMAAGVARGELGRAWAWQSLGLMRRSVPESNLPGAVDDLVSSLVMRPTEVVPALGELARQGMLRLLARRMHVGQWIRISQARAALAGLASASPRDVGWEPVEPVTGPPALAGARSEQHSRLAVELSARSPIFAALTGQDSVVQDPEARHAVALLVVLEAQPGAAFGGAERAERLIAGVAHLLAVAGRSASLPLRNDPLDFSSPPDTDESTPADAQAADQPPGRDLQPVVFPAAREPARSGAQAEPPASRESPSESASGYPRRRAWTENGGLLYLVHLVDRLHLPERLMTTPELANRPLPWSLHQIAIHLCGAADDDPAALAFSGLGPDALPPSREAPPATEKELAALEALASELAQSLADALERRTERPQSVVAEICSRRAEIVADLGWIEVLFRLDDVSLEVRRAGLDLDPGWVLWLGVVLRFVYA